VFVEGRIQTRSWEGQDGQKRRVTEIIANDVQFLEPRGAGVGAGAREGASAGAGAARASGGAATEEPTGDDVPRDVDPDDIPF
jgi:single-strand DNA-binding protein